MWMTNRSSDRFHPTPREMARAVSLFKVLSHPDRVRLACSLGDGRTTTQKELVEEFGWPQSTAARHITALRNAGLVSAERDGSEVLLRMANPVVLDILQTVCDWVHHAPPSGAGVPDGTVPLGAYARLWPTESPQDGASLEEGPTAGSSS